MPNVSRANHINNSLVKFLVVLAVGMTALFSDYSHAVTPDEVLPDKVLESRARALSTKLRCLVCQNQSIDDSDAPLAKDLRVLLRKRLVAGDSDDQVIDYLVSRYGEFVLLQPKIGMKTILLWGAPIALIIAGAFALLFSYRGRKLPKTAGTQMLSEEEHQRITKILDEGE